MFEEEEESILQSNGVNERHDQQLNSIHSSEEYIAAESGGLNQSNILRQKFRYLSVRGIENLKKNKYCGEDHSLYYSYFASPLASYLNERFMPLWVAPNVITLSGFFLVLFSHMLLWINCPTTKEEYSPWMATITGLFIFIYQTLDNMDGKQARRTGTSSPLGQILDHGCDSLTLTLLSVNIAILAGVDPGLSLGLICSSMISAFYVTLWEEYHLHRFQLPVINGPNEGLVGSIILCFLAGYYGREWFDTPFIGTLSKKDTLLFVFGSSAVLTVFSHTYRTLSNLEPGPFQSKQDAKSLAIKRLTPLFIFISYILVVGGSPSVQKIPHLFYWTVGLNFTRMDSLFMLRMVCKEEAEIFPSYLWPMLIISFYSLLFQSGLVLYSDEWLIVSYFMWSFVTFCDFASRLVNELCSALEIQAFRI